MGPSLLSPLVADVELPFIQGLGSTVLWLPAQEEVGESTMLGNPLPNSSLSPAQC